MKIGFDGKRATQNLTGLGNYSRYLISLLAKFYPLDHFIIYAIRRASPGISIPRAEYKYPRRPSINSMWRSYGIVSTLVKDKIDLFHGLSNEIPLGLKKARIQSVVTIHDLIFIRYPQYYSFPDRLIYKIKFRHAVSNSDKIIAISEQTKQDIVQYFGITEDKIEVIYQDCNPIFHQAVTERVRNEINIKYKLPVKYLLNVGTIEERKNLLLIAKALLKIDNINLVVVGRETKYTRTVKNFIYQNNLMDRVHFLQNVEYHDLPAIYQQAEIFIYPSRFEGFGIPIIEALHSGIPVIAAKGSCLEEAGGPGSVYVQPDDDLELSVQIKSILEDPAKRIKMVNAGRLYLDKFDGKRISGQIMQLYQNVINNA